MTRLALVLGLVALLVSGVGLSVGRAAGPAHETSIFYYPWYGNPQFDASYEHWDQNGHVPPYDLASSFYPARGPYSSADPKIVAAQMNEIAAAGVKEVVSSWWGWGSPEDLRLPMIVQMARKAGLEVAAQIEPYDERTAEGVAADIGHLRTLGVGRFYVYHPFLIADADWQAALPTVTGVQVLAQTTNVLRAKTDRFGGVYTYDVYNYGPATFGPLCQKAHSLGLICAPSVGPGYDALRATGDTHIKERAGGATYDAMWKAAIRAGADRVTITSYNEWHEGTQIEPALTSIPRRLETAARPSSSPVAQAYETYNGAFGLKGRQASRAYLIRTGYWTAAYRSGSLTSTAPDTTGKVAAHGRNTGSAAEVPRMPSVVSRLSSSALPFSLAGAVRAMRNRPSRHAAWRVSTHLRSGVATSRLMRAVRVTGSDSVARPLGRAAPWLTRKTREWSCYPARRPHTLLGMSVITRCASSSIRSRRTCTRRTASTTVSYWGKARRSKGG